MGCIETSLDKLIAEDAGAGVDEPFVLGCEPIKDRRGRRPNPESRRFNQALHRIARGKGYDIGGVCHELAVLTGLTIEAIRSRIADAEYDYPPEDLEPGIGLTSDDKKYMNSRYGSFKDPAVREWLQSVNGTQRKDPDHEDARVKRRRINGRLTSESMGIRKN